MEQHFPWDFQYMEDWVKQLANYLGNYCNYINLLVSTSIMLWNHNATKDREFFVIVVIAQSVITNSTSVVWKTISHKHYIISILLIPMLLFWDILLHVLVQCHKFSSLFFYVNWPNWFRPRIQYSFGPLP